ncbi:MAG: hypothetical protein LBR64_02570 [Dysgonamonadaceae bacterium]|jgi:hypothetical protein|nr:hypothetical protein [Dysgonamonadaceae bacterium]
METKGIGRKIKRFLIVFLLIILVFFAGFLYIRYYYVWGEGVKSGQLNYVVYKGYVFKTYEGKLIQAGFKSGANTALQSNEFIFSVDDKDVAERLMLEGGKEVELHYREYLHAIPWRGYSKYVVDSIIKLED